MLQRKRLSLALASSGHLLVMIVSPTRHAEKGELVVAHK